MSLLRTTLLPLALAGVLVLAPLPAAHADVEGVAGPYLAAIVAADEKDVKAAAEYFDEALAHDPANIELMARALTYNVAAGRIERAVELARELIRHQPEQRLAKLVLAVDALVRGAPEEVRRLLDPGEHEGGALVERLLRAWAAFDAGDVETARAELAALAAREDGDAATRLLGAYHLALVEAAAGRDAEALAELDRLHELSGRETARTIMVRAGVLARLGRIEEALAAIDEGLQRAPTNRRLELLRRDLEAGRIPPPLVRTGREGAAEVLYGVAGFFIGRERDHTVGMAYGELAAHLDPELIEARLLVAELLFRVGQYRLAIEAFERIPPEAPEALEAALNRAEALFELGRREEALVLMRETARANPRSVEVLTRLGSMLRRAERFAEAAEAFSEAIALIGEPERRHWRLFYERGISYERSKQWEKAEADFLKALELEPDQPFVLNYLGYSWVEMGKNLGEAKRMIEKAVEQRPNDGFIVDSLGWVLYRMGRFEEAVKHLERAVELEPVDPVINDHYGDALWMVGRRKEARFQWKRALSFEPEEKDAERIRRKLAVGLDKVLAEEEAAGKVTIIRSTENGEAPGNDGG